MPQGDPRPGEKYLHFKNKLYQITAIAQHSETGERMVVYQALYGTFQTYVRPYDMFVGPVDKQKYPQVKQKYRFQWVEFRKAETAPARREIPEEEAAGEQDFRKIQLREEPAKRKASAKEQTGGEVPRQEPAMEKNPGKERAGEEAPRQEPAIEKNSGKERAGEEASRQEPVKKEPSAEEKMLAFFDADTAEEKYQVLLTMRDEVTDRMINNMAVVLDVVIEEGPLDLRYEELKSCLRTIQRYDCSRLR